jgi:hypothetical protein
MDTDYNVGAIETMRRWIQDVCGEIRRGSSQAVPKSGGGPRAASSQAGAAGGAQRGDAGVGAGVVVVEVGVGAGAAGATDEDKSEAEEDEGALHRP